MISTRQDEPKNLFVFLLWKAAFLIEIFFKNHNFSVDRQRKFKYTLPEFVWKDTILGYEATQT